MTGSLQALTISGVNPFQPVDTLSVARAGVLTAWKVWDHLSSRWIIRVCLPKLSAEGEVTAQEIQSRIRQRAEEKTDFNAELPIGTLPAEVLTYILSFLSDPRDIKSANAVCRSFRPCVGDNPPLWKSACSSLYGVHSTALLARANIDPKDFVMNEEARVPTRAAAFRERAFMEHYSRLVVRAKEILRDTFHSADTSILDMPAENPRETIYKRWNKEVTWIGAQYIDLPPDDYLAILFACIEEKDLEVFKVFLDCYQWNETFPECKYVPKSIGDVADCIKDKLKEVNWPEGFALIKREYGKIYLSLWSKKW